jgi:hypothetical protein
VLEHMLSYCGDGEAGALRAAQEYNDKVAFK